MSLNIYSVEKPSLNDLVHQIWKHDFQFPLNTDLKYYKVRLHPDRLITAKISIPGTEFGLIFSKDVSNKYNGVYAVGCPGWEDFLTQAKVQVYFTLSDENGTVLKEQSIDWEKCQDWGFPNFFSGNMLQSNYTLNVEIRANKPFEICM